MEISKSEKKHTKSFDQICWEDSGKTPLKTNMTIDNGKKTLEDVSPIKK